MKKSIYVIILVFMMGGCNDNKRVTPDEEPISEDADTIDRMFSRDDVEREQDNVVTEDEGAKTLQTPTDHPFAGQYKLVGEDNAGPCNCNCLEISFTTPTRLCIAPDGNYIFVRFTKTGSNTANVYLVGPMNAEDQETELPYEEFDRDTPIATLNLQPNGTLELDWKGFAINGDIATDYAIFGKKTLEGSYERQ